MKRCTRLLLSMIACLSMLLLFAPSANAGLFGRCHGGNGLFGRRASATSCSSGYATYSYQTAAPCAPCGQATYSYGYAAPAPCAPCGQQAAPLPAYGPPVQPLNAPTIQSTPGVSYRYARPPQIACPDGRCSLRR